jgi:hypothetical protein
MSERVKGLQEIFETPEARASILGAEHRIVARNQCRKPSPEGDLRAILFRVPRQERFPVQAGTP